jgi:hypothetical protein
MAVAQCPEPRSWQQLLAGDLPALQLAELTDHLSDCPPCQAALEAAASGTGNWSAVARDIAHDTPPPKSAYWPALAQLGGPMPDAKPNETQDLPATTDEELDFLEPTDVPGMVGQLGRFAVSAVVGKGGMGLVLKATDMHLQRVVALKVLNPNLAKNALARKRFCREARAAAAVTHENIVVTHSVEESSGVPHLVMQFIPGLSLQEQLDRFGALEPADVIRLGRQIALGLAAAHAQGVIHRDIKPGNIMLENGVERVKITDFGLARAAEDLKLTQTGFIAGTPLYMSPEQARGEELDHRADLFSLGSVLYAAVTGLAPFEGNTPFVVLRRVTEEAPKPLVDLKPGVPVGLVAVIEKLLAKAPTDRYQSAQEVANALTVLMPCYKGPAALSAPALPVRRDAGWLYGLAGGVVLGVGMAFGNWFLAGKSEPTPVSVAPLACGPAPKQTLEGRAGPVWAVSFAPDNATVAMALDDGTVRLWDPHTGRVKGTFEAHAGPVWGLAYACDGQHLATVSDDGLAKLWTLTERTDPIQLKHPGAVRTVAFTRAGRLLVTGGRDGGVRLWDPLTGKETATTRGHKGTVVAVAVAADGKTVASAGGDKTIKLWDTETGMEQVTLTGHTGGVYAVALNPDGTLVASGGWDRTVRLWDANTGTEKRVLRGHTLDVWSAAFSPDGTLLATASEDRTVRLWDVATGTLRATFAGHEATVYTVAFAHDGKLLASGSRDGTVRVWAVEP